MTLEPDVRDMMRKFAQGSRNPRLLRWDSALDTETGGGVRIALLDSGVLWEHPMFQGAYLKVRDFTGNGGVFDPTGHGTKNAALLVAQGRSWLRGVIPACTLLVGKVVRTGNPDTSARVLAQAIRWAVHNKVDIAILPIGRTQGSALVDREIRRALSAECALFAAGGNRGPDTLLFPARLEEVIAISAACPDGTPLSWCCQDCQVDCYAPGHEVLSVGLEGQGTISGSSPATVLAAGIAALWLARERRLRIKR